MAARTSMHQSRIYITVSTVMGFPGKGIPQNSPQKPMKSRSVKHGNRNLHRTWPVHSSRASPSFTGSASCSTPAACTGHSPAPQEEQHLPAERRCGCFQAVPALHLLTPCSLPAPLAVLEDMAKGREAQPRLYHAPAAPHCCDGVMAARMI